MFRGKQDYFYLGETKTSFIEEKNLSSWKLQDFHRGRWEEEAHMKQNIHKMAGRLGGHRVLACMLSGFSRVWLWNPMDCGPPSSSVHGIHQARILERVAMPSSRGLPDSGIKPASLMSPAVAGGLFTTSATWEAYCVLRKGKKLTWKDQNCKRGLETGHRFFWAFLFERDFIWQARGATFSFQEENKIKRC